LPGYEIIAELGRGGMGVVYKARELKLNRLVAIKTILSGDHASSESCRRFLGEAEAVARLHHPNIVQIYAFGDQDGLPYFTMEYVAGGSLADRLAGEPWESARAARLLETLARAVHEVHRLGVVHRDLKPANVLLSTEGVPKIADFGLAKFLDVETGTTRTQLIVGSPNYMAPEQAGGSDRLIGPAADIYSLGAILYELLTGRPTFRGATVLETLELVKTAEPIPPRRLQPKLPRDLATICMKCLQKEPSKRYADAAALAEDVRRFSSGQPIHARPVSAPERLWRWCRREPALAALTFVLIAGLIGVTTQWWRAEVHLKEAASERALAGAHLAAAKRERGRAEDNWLAQIEANRALQATRDREATAHRRAQERFDLALKALRGIQETTSDPRLMSDVRLEGLRGKLLAAALGFYRELQASLEDDASPEARSQLSEAYNRVASISWELGMRDEALAAHRRALLLMEQLAAAAPSDAKIREALARCHTRIGFTLRTTERQAEALEPYERAREIQEQLARDYPTDPHYPEILSWTLSNLGVIHRDLGRLDEAIRFHRRAIAIHEALVKQDPANAEYRSELAWCWRYLCLALVATGDYASALPLAERAASVHEVLVAANGSNADHRWRLARCLDEVGRIRTRIGQVSEAAAPLQRSARFYASVARDNPALYRLDVVRNELNLAYQRAMTGRIDEAFASIRKAEDLLERTSLVWPVLYVDLGCAYSLCSAATRTGGAPSIDLATGAERAIAALRRAIASGYRDLAEVRREPALDPLRGRADFQALMLDLSFPADPFGS
jgi:serine/threonine-protein kinase